MAGSRQAALRIRATLCFIHLMAAKLMLSLPRPNSAHVTLQACALSSTESPLTSAALAEASLLPAGGGAAAQWTADHPLPGEGAPPPP
eukprot:1151182-Pelagomonas_calceolata.AAC.2